MASVESYTAFVQSGEAVFDQLPFGKIVAVAWLDQCYSTNFNTHVPGSLETLWGNYSPDRWAWAFTECYRLNTPLPVRGEQKLFDVQMPDRWQDQATKVF